MLRGSAQAPLQMSGQWGLRCTERVVGEGVDAAGLDHGGVASVLDFDLL
jgi:hypothetical protein